MESTRPAGGHVATAPPRGTFRLLLDPTVGSFASAKLTGAVGIWIYNVVAAVVVFQLTRSALLVGAVSIAQFTPQVLLGPWMGARADRGNRRRLAVAGRLVSGGSSGALAVWIGVAGIDALTAGHVIAATLVTGIGFAVSGPAMHAIVPALARPSELAGVIAIITAPFTVARAVGPALGAVLLVTAGPGAAFAIAALCHVVQALVVSRVRLRTVDRKQSSDGSVRAGLRFLRHHVPVLLLLVAVAGVGFGVDPVITLTPPIADGYGAGPELVALMASAFGAGAAVMVPLLGLIRQHVSQARIGASGLGVLAASMVALAASPVPDLAVASLFVGGMGMMGAVTSLTTQIQQRVPEEFRGRVMALWSVCFVGSRPVAAAFNGAVADWWGPEIALLGVAALLAGISVLTRPSRTATH